MWYAIHRKPDNNEKMAGFINDEAGDPIAMNTEDGIKKMTDGHVLEPLCEYIEIE